MTLNKLLLVAITFFISSPAFAQQFDSNLAWPLCGRIAEAPPVGWTDSDGCPQDRWGNTDHADLPLASPFGPRPLVSENDRYDFHRGIDIATPVGTPVFAIADGIARIAGDHASYSDPLVQLRHYRPGNSSCSNVGCYHSNYMHLSSVVIAVDDVVSKGDLIGYTGVSGSGFAHLHFEIRDAPAFDPFSSWQRDAIHPLGVLPYQSTEVPVISFDQVDNLTDPARPVVQVNVQVSRADVSRIEIIAFDSAGNVVAQPGNVPDINGYNVNPSWFDMDEWNFQYTHKNSSGFPWESYGEGGENECPYYFDHATSYSAHVHLDQQHPDDFHVGSFNGIDILPQRFNEVGQNLTLTFNELVGPAECFVVEVSFASGGIASAEWGNCSGSPIIPPTADDQSIQTNEDTSVFTILTGTPGSGETLSYEIVRQPSHGTLSGDLPSVIYVPDAGYSGPDSFDFHVNDGVSNSDPATVSISVISINTAPIADDQSVVTNKNTSLGITLTASDADGDALIFAISSGPANGTLSGSGTDWTYTPDNNYTGNDSFIFRVDDGKGGIDTGTVSINVKKGKGDSGGGSGGGGGGGKGGGKPSK